MFAKPPVFFAQIHVGYSALSFDSDCNNAAIGVRFTTRVTQKLPVREPASHWIRSQGDGLLITPLRPDWASFFAINIDLPDDFLEGRKDDPPQTRDPL